MDRWVTRRALSSNRHPARKSRRGGVAAVLVGCLLITGVVVVAPYGSPGAAFRSHVHGLPAAAMETAQFGSAGAAGPHDHFQTLPAAAMEAAPAAMPRTGWTASASDEEVTGQNGRAGNVLDGNVATIWHSESSPAPGAPLPHTITIDTKETRSIAGFRYLPRPDLPDGRVGSFEIRVSTDGTTWSTPVAHGTWPDTSAEKSATFTAVPARYVRLTATTEAGNRGPWSSAAEINLIAGTTPAPAANGPEINLMAGTTPAPAATGVLPRTGWVASASDQEVTGMNGRASNVLDGSATTIWHSVWSPAPKAPLPHTITIDTKATRSISGLRYLPRSDIPKGRIGKYSVGVSSNGTTWSVVKTGTWPDTGTEKTVTFTEVRARYVRLTAITEAGNRGPWSSAAEINLLGPVAGIVGADDQLPARPGRCGPIAWQPAADLVFKFPHLSWRHQGQDRDVHPEPHHRQGDPVPGVQHRTRHVLPRDLDAAGRKDPDQRRQQQLENHPVQPCDERLDFGAGHEDRPRLPVQRDHVHR